MKQSYYSAPRSMQEATWVHGCDPIEKPYTRRSGIGWWIAASVVALLALSLIAGRG